MYKWAPTFNKKNFINECSLLFLKQMSYMNKIGYFERPAGYINFWKRSNILLGSGKHLSSLNRACHGHTNLTKTKLKVQMKNIISHKLSHVKLCKNLHRLASSKNIHKIMLFVSTLHQNFTVIVINRLLCDYLK